MVSARVEASHAITCCDPLDALEAELYARARELQRLNEELRPARTREREVAVTLQEAMLQAPDPAQHEDVAMRHLPAAGSLNVCGDWYDLVDLTDGRFTVAVGDVVGHGLKAAADSGSSLGLFWDFRPHQRVGA